MQQYPSAAQAIASLSPVQCRLLEYKVSSITEVWLTWHFTPSWLAPYSPQLHRS